MTFDKLVVICKEYIASEGKSTKPQFPEQWTQGRTAFGGLSAGLLLAASEQKVSTDKELHSVFTNFIGPLIVNTPFEIEVTVLREGKNVVQILTKAIQNGQVALLQQSSYGTKRKSQINLNHIPTHSMIKPEKPLFMPATSENIPKFIQNFDLFISDGGQPFSGSTSSHTHGWMRFKEAPKAITNAHIMCLIDTWPPTIAQQLNDPAPLSSMSWYLEFINPNSECDPRDWLSYQCDASYAQSGYGHTDAYIWSGSGDVIAKSHQTIAVFD